MSKISDFKLAYSAIRDISRKQGVEVKDFDVVFDKSGRNYMSGSSIVIGETNSLPHTLYSIVETYAQNAALFSDKPVFANDDVKTMYLMHFAATVRSMDASEKFFKEADIGGFTLSRLYHISFIWNAMKNIICPMYSCRTKNVLLAEGSSDSIDAARFYKKGETADPQAPDEPFIFVNRSVKNIPISSSHVLCSAIEAHDLDPSDVIKKVLESSANRPFLGLVDLAFDEEESDEFMSALMKITDLNPSYFPHIKMAYNAAQIKKAQWYDSPGQANNPQWWWFGLPEKMLEPARGYDWSVRQNLEHWITDFWDQVEEIKQKMPQGEGVPFDNLLRLKADESMEKPLDTNMTIQGLLKDQRIWQ